MNVRMLEECFRSESIVCVYVTWNVVVNGGVCPGSARVARSTEQRRTCTCSLETGTFSVTPSF